MRSNKLAVPRPQTRPQPQSKPQPRGRSEPNLLMAGAGEVAAVEDDIVHSGELFQKPEQGGKS